MAADWRWALACQQEELGVLVVQRRRRESGQSDVLCESTISPF